MEILFLHLYLFVLGLVLGSFYNVVGMRLPLGQSIVRPRSHCPNCQHQLTASELIPVLSFFLQKGKCKACGKQISLFYPLIEFATALLFALAPLFVGWTAELLVALLFISLLIIVLVSDLKYMIIPDRVLIFFVLAFGISRIFAALEPWWDPLMGAAVGFSLLYFIAVVSRGGMGGGDVKLYGALGLVLGVKNVLLSFFLASLFGAVIGGIGLLLGIFKRKQPIPFAPFIVAGSLLAYFFGNQLIELYLQWL